MILIYKYWYQRNRIEKNGVAHIGHQTKGKIKTERSCKVTSLSNIIIKMRLATSPWPNQQGVAMRSSHA